MSTYYGEHTRPAGFTSHLRATGPMFYLGTHRPNWLTFADVPLFISAATMAKWRTSGDDWPTRKAGSFGCGVWALDSGAYTALTSDNRAHPWHRDSDTYGGVVTRFVDEIGVPPTFAAIQDYPCESGALARTGMTVADHQELTTASYLDLAENFPFIPWMPTLQGWAPDDYLAHAEQYAAAGVDLTTVERVGVGSICRRGSDNDIAAVVGTLAGRGMRLHGFGVKTSAMRRIGHLFTSADSMAWSDAARHRKLTMPSCVARGAHGGQDPARIRRAPGAPVGTCNNCFDWALAWREGVIAAAAQSGTVTQVTPRRPAAAEQLTLDLFAAAGTMCIGQRRHRLSDVGTAVAAANTPRASYP